MKTSNLILTSIITALLLGSISYAFYIKANTSERPSPLPSSFLESKGPYFEDTIATPYSVIRSNFPVIFLDPRYEDTLIIDGYENAREYIDYYVHGDTLEVLNANTESNYRISEGKINSEYTLKVTIGAKNLKGLWLFGQGGVTHDARPTGARLDGTNVYSQSTLDKYKLQLDDLHLTIRDNAQLKLFLSVNRVDMDHYYTGRSTNTLSYDSPNSSIFALNSSLNFIGEAQCLSMINPKGAFGINAQYLKLDSLIVKEDGTYNSGGTIYANPSKYLRAELHSNLNITHDGTAQVTDIIETGPGRTINTNKAFNSARNSESQKRTKELVKIAQKTAAQVKDGSLRMLSTSEVITLVRENNGFLGKIGSEPVTKNQEGKILSQIEIKQAAIDSLGSDIFVDANGEIKEIVLRPKNATDERVWKIVQSIRKKEVAIKNQFINCNNIREELAKIGANKENNLDQHLQYIVNVLRKCETPTKASVGEGMNTVYKVFQQAPLQYRIEYLSLIEDAGANGDLQDAQVQQFKKGISLDEAIMKTYYEYPRVADEDNDQKIYERILRLAEKEDRASLGLESLDRLLSRIGIKYEEVVL